MADTSHQIEARGPGRELIHRLVADEAPVILWMTDPDGRHVYYNRRWYEFTGTRPANGAGGEFWLESLHDDDRDACLQQIKAAMRDHQPMRLTYRLRNASGDYCWMLDQSRPCFGADGEFLGYVGAVVDISEQKRAEAELERTNHDLERANRHARINREMNDHLQVCRNLDEVRAVLANYVPTLFSRSSGGVYMINESRSLVEPVTQWGALENSDTLFGRGDCWALRQGKAHQVTGDHGVTCPHLDDRPAHGYLCIPLISHGDVMGLLHLQNHHEDQMLDDYRYQLALNTAENLSLALSSFRLRQALQHQSVRDPLTQLFNRRYMYETLEKELARSQRHETGLAVIMLDVDHFKRFNDTHGHAAGDAVLQELAAFLVANLRAEDIASRYGGEEFTLVLGGIDRDTAGQRANELCRGVRRLEVATGEQHLRGFSISVGVALYPGNGDAPDELLAAADRALYRAKQAGRNRVCLAGEDESAA